MNRNTTEQRTERHRSGKTLVLFVLLLPVLLAFSSLVIDGSLMLGEQRGVQHLADAAAMAAAQERMLGGTSSDELAAVNRVLELNNASDTVVHFHSTPYSGPFSGNSDYVEVILTRTFRPHLFNAFGDRTIRAGAVAGIAAATDNPAIVLLGSNPTLSALAAIGDYVPALPAAQAALEVRGSGKFHVHDAIVVNSNWGGVDGNGDPAGTGPGPPWAVARIGTGKLESTYLYTAGGVDDLQNYDTPARILANRRPMEDPLKDLPEYTITGADPVQNGPIKFAGGSFTLSPGIYKSIEIRGATVVFQPGIYIISDVDPQTGIGLHLKDGNVTARGVMFFIMSRTGSTPSVVLDIGSGTHEFTGLVDSSSDYDAMTIFQNRDDTRPIVLVNSPLVNNRFEGVVYAKSAPVVLVGGGLYDVAFIADSMRVVIDEELDIHSDAPNHVHLTPARDVFLVQ